MNSIRDKLEDLLRIFFGEEIVGVRWTDGLGPPVYIMAMFLMFSYICPIFSYIRGAAGILSQMRFPYGFCDAL